MNRLFLILALTAGLASAASAQQTFILSTLKHKGFVSLTAGYSLPTVSAFGKNTEKMMDAGQSGQVSVGYRFGQRLGMVASFSHVTNSVRTQALLESAARNAMGINTWQANATNCSLQALMAGPMVTFSAGRFLFDAQLTAGYALASSPRTEVFTEYARMPLSMITPSQTTGSLAAGAGLTARFKLNRWLAAHASAQYITADLKYDNLMQEVQIGKQVSTTPVASHQPIGLLNLGGGLSFLF
jgi:hypothetical protein